MPSKNRKGRSRREELQRLLGEDGTVLPRLAHGTPEQPAQGWYAELPEGRVFLGDYTSLAADAIRELRLARRVAKARAQPARGAARAR